MFVQVQGAAVFGGGAPLAQRAVPAGGPEDDGVLGGELPGDPGRAGHGPRGRIDGEVIAGEAAGDGGQERPGLDHRPVPGCGDRRAQVPGAVGRIAVPGSWPPARHGDRHRRRRRLPRTPRRPRRQSSRPGGPGQLLIGDDPGLRVGGHVGAVAVAAGLGGLAGVPGLGIHGGDHPVFGDLAGDPPPPVPAVGALAGSTSCPATSASSATAEAAGSSSSRLRTPPPARSRRSPGPTPARPSRPGHPSRSSAYLAWSSRGRRTPGRSFPPRRAPPAPPGGSPRPAGSRCPGWPPHPPGSWSPPPGGAALQDPGLPITFLTASLTRCGRADFAIRRRQYTSVEGSKPRSSSGAPIATFHRTSKRTASQSPGPNSHAAPAGVITAAICVAGSDGRPTPTANKSA